MRARKQKPSSRITPYFRKKFVKFLPSFNAAALILIIMSILLPTVDTLDVFAALLTFWKVSLESISNSLSSVISLQSSFSMFFSVPVFTFRCSMFNILEHLLVFYQYMEPSNEDLLSYLVISGCYE